MEFLYKNEVVVQAAQFVDEISCMYMEDDWGLPYCEAVTFLGRQGRHMQTPEGLVKVNPGDWIVKFPDDTFRSVSEDNFQKDYRSVSKISKTGVSL
ncbi:hypothetical protein [Bdellovibrio sp. BCCA]|uniref:hypothetical protein n=1 Tax=Bdellovibrio sp. BCCA TaxID=3136281 RepID=UPI0030F20278